MEIYIDTDQASQSVKIFVFEDRGTKRVCYHYDKGQLTEIEHDLNTPGFTEWAKPLIELPRGFYEALEQKILVRASDNGIQTKEGSFKDGKIEAMGEHLTDLQKIVTKVLKLDI